MSATGQWIDDAATGERVFKPFPKGLAKRYRRNRKAAKKARHARRVQRARCVVKAIDLVRIVCKAPPTPAEVENDRLTPARYPRIMGVVPSLADVEVLAISDDGTSTPLTNIASVEWSVEGANPARATITFTNVEIDADAVPAFPAIDKEGREAHASCESCGWPLRDCDAYSGPDEDGVYLCRGCFDPTAQVSP